MSTNVCPNCTADNPAIFYDDATDNCANVVDTNAAGGCSECYTNDSCPAACNEPHGIPDDHSESWTCPTTDERFRPDGTPGCGVTWEADSYGEGSTSIGGTWYPEPYDQGWSTCDGCSDWTDSDEMNWNERDETSYCPNCYDESGSGGGGDSSRYATCKTCHRSLTHGPIHFDTESEYTYCTTHSGEVNSLTIRELVAV